ncbi:MAG: 1,4-dihydroxy-6-naphthoate synthase [Sphingobacteriaceae bacterium]|nr:1,4-dihydroxy-6-naphthoate synthase [Sphingobacteriaceae bacterium]
MKLTLAYSPCPNDCFIFDAIANKRIDTEGLEFEITLGDVEFLNKQALLNVFDITKLSFFAYGFALKNYVLLRSGSALGFNCGPLFIKTNGKNLNDLENIKIAIPGKYTTAHFLLSLAYPQIKNKKEYLFSDIENAVLNGEVDAGLIIHENRFTYENKGLVKIRDLGEFWQELIEAPIPLGGIVARRNFEKEMLQTINRVIKRSIQYAFKYPEIAMDYIRLHAQELNDEVIKRHINLYVNEYSVDLGANGMEAIELLFSKAEELELIEKRNKSLFID